MSDIDDTIQIRKVILSIQTLSEEFQAVSDITDIHRY
jgi:hypothetical protein